MAQMMYLEIDFVYDSSLEAIAAKSSVVPNRDKLKTGSSI